MLQKWPCWCLRGHGDIFKQTQRSTWPAFPTHLQAALGVRLLSLWSHWHACCVSWKPAKPLAPLPLCPVAVINIDMLMNGKKPKAARWRLPQAAGAGYQGPHWCCWATWLHVRVSPKPTRQLRKPESFLPPQSTDQSVAAPQPCSPAIFSQFCYSRLGRDAMCCLPHRPLSLLSCLLPPKSSSWCDSCSPGILLVTGGAEWRRVLGWKSDTEGKWCCFLLPLVRSHSLKLKREQWLSERCPSWHWTLALSWCVLPGVLHHVPCNNKSLKARV